MFRLSLDRTLQVPLILVVVAGFVASGALAQDKSKISQKTNPRQAKTPQTRHQPSRSNLRMPSIPSNAHLTRNSAREMPKA
jgi:hypothetical protein